MVTPAVNVIKLSFAYPDGHAALHEISLSVQPGEKVALVGPNGAGKSTLLLHLNGILSGSGLVQIAGQEVNRRTLHSVRAAVGLVFQLPDDQLFSPTVEADVAYGPIYQGLPAATVRERVDEALRAVGMEAYARRVPHHLSIGEKKRAALATVLAMQPSILALDEPTSGLDPRARRELALFLARLPQTLLIATHDLPFARKLCPRTVVMDAGEIVADCPSETLFADQALLAAHGLDETL